MAILYGFAARCRLMCAQANQTYYVSLNEYIDIHMDKTGRVVDTPMN